ncbi:sugar ABC transporter substrate-binding protein [Nonomuraea turkmeniaca]|nr:substrate-binding domain-containing protein [Nonomuraea turkmeniaca]
MKKSQYTAVAGLGVAALALAGCTGTTTPSTGATSKAGATIAFSTVSTQIPLITSLSDKVSDYLGGSGYKVTVQDSAFDPVKQGQQLEQAANSGSIAGAWIFPVAAESLTSTLKMFQSKKIPVVVDGGPSDFGLQGAQPGIVFVASDFKKYGQTIGDEAAKCAVKAGATQALSLRASETAAGSVAVRDSIGAAFSAGAPDTQVVGTAVASDLASAQTKVSQLLIAHPDASVVIAATDETALGAVNAYAAAGKTPACIIAGGGGPDLMAAKQAGKVTAVVAWDYGAEAEKAGADLIRLLSDPTSDGGVFTTPINVTK